MVVRKREEGSRRARERGGGGREREERREPESEKMGEGDLEEGGSQRLGGRHARTRPQLQQPVADV